MSKIRYVTAGESHGPELTVIIEGLPAGLHIDSDMIRADLARRQLALGAGARMAMETDTAVIKGGVMNGLTTGAPVALTVANGNHVAWKGKDVAAYVTPRPGHADLAAVIKYGYDDVRQSLERSSARETAARVAAAACERAFLKVFGIEVRGKVLSIGGVTGEEAIEKAIADAKKDGETLGGVIEIVVTGVPVGLGSFATAGERLDARLACALMGMNAIKGVEIGDGFALASAKGTKAQDPIRLGKDGALVRSSNRMGGIEGGISNGEPIVLRAAMKPIPTTISAQPTVNLVTGEEAMTVYERSDTCPVPRGVVVAEACVIDVIASALAEKLGGDSIAEMKPRFDSLRKANVADAHLCGEPQVFWS